MVDRTIGSKKDMHHYPRCWGRGLLTTHFNGKHSEHRVLWRKLASSLKLGDLSLLQLDKAKHPDKYPKDEYGYFPEPIEKFLETLEEGNAMVATKKGAAPRSASAKKKKVATHGKQKPIGERVSKKKKKAAESNGNASLGAAGGDPTKNDPTQPSLPGMGDERIPMIETCVKKILDAQSERKNLKDDIEEAQGKLAGLLKKNKLTNYKCLGKVVCIEPGADIVKIKKVKDK